MELYLINIDIHDKGQFQLILEGDDHGANDGDWKAMGGGGAVLGQLSGYWRYHRRQNELGWWQIIDLREGEDPNAVSWLWRTDWDSLAYLRLPPGVPYLGGDVFLLDPGNAGEGNLANRSSFWAWDLRWKVVRRFF